ncbi:MAG: hypothetical protein AAGE80_12160 [Pseudomonadota bacterium]
MRTLVFGKFGCASPVSGQALLDDVCRRAGRDGYEAVIGPMDGDTWHTYRLVIESEGSAPFLMEPPENAAAIEALDRSGFQIINRYFSARLPVEQVADGAIQEATDLRIDAWDGSNPDAFFAEVHDLSCQAFAGNPFYQPISRGAFLDLYRPYVPMMRPDLIFFARDASGSAQGFLFGIPNYLERPEPRSVILKTYAGIRRGVGSRLSAHFHSAARRLGFENVIHALIHDDNVSAARSEALGAEVFRRYALFGRRLNG